MNQCDAQLALLRSQIGLISRTEKSTVTPPKDFISKVEGGYFVNFVRDESVGLPIECHTERTRISCSSSLSVQKFPREIFVLFFYWATNSISVATIYFHKFFFSFCGTYFFLAPVRKRWLIQIALSEYTVPFLETISVPFLERFSRNESKSTWQSVKICFQDNQLSFTYTVNGHIYL